MPLDNTAKLSDIISALQTMEGIHAKADLASVVGSPANADDTMATINNVIQSAKNTLAEKMDDGSNGTESLQELVDKLVMGKKWAKGNASVKEVAVINYVGNKYGTSPAIEVTGLDFRPSVILVTYSIYESAVYYNLYEKYNGIEVVNQSNSGTTLYRAQEQGLYVRHGGFCIPSPTAYTSGTRQWYAFE